MAASVKLSEYVMNFVADHGVRDVFFLPGGGAMHLNDSLGRSPGLNPVCMLHEQAAAIAAEAYGKITNDLAACLVTTGPGGTNTVTGVAGAWLDSIPVLFLSGQVKRPDLKRDSGVRILGVQEIDIVSIIASITKYAATIEDPQSIKYHLEKAVHFARLGRRGPVWIDIPLDVQATRIDPDTLPSFEPELHTSYERARAKFRNQVSHLVELLNKAKRPVLLAGNGIRAAGAADLFLDLINRLQIPVLTSWLGMDLIPHNHPLCFGRPGSLAPRGANFTLQNCDLLIVVGCRLDMAMTAYAHERLARGATKVMVDIDEAEIRKMRTPIALPVVADAGAFLNELNAVAEKVRPGRWSGWIKRSQYWKDRYPLVLAEHRELPNHISMYHFSKVLSDALAEGDVIAPASSGFAVEIFLLCLEIKAGQRQFHNRGTGAMGFGLPAAVGAAVASGRRTVSVDGDGGFQMNIQDLATVARLGLPIKFFIINNNGYASIRASQKGYFNRLIGADPSSGLTLPDLGRLAGAYGVAYRRIDHREGMAAVVREVLEAPGPVVCEVFVAPNEERIPRASSYQRQDGSMASKPLEDLFPYLPREEFLRNLLIQPIQD